MPTYRVIINGQETGETVIASSYADAYFDVASTMALTYKTDVKLVPVEAADTPASANQAMDKAIAQNRNRPHLHDEPSIKQNQNVYDALSE